MSVAGAMLIVVAVFVLIGAATAVVMGRRGHDPWMWGVLGALFGPLVVPLAISGNRRDADTTEISLRTGVASANHVAVLAGVDGSPESIAATRAAVDLMADRLGSLTLATVVDLDAIDAINANRSEPSVFERDAQALLDRAAAQIGAANPATVILGGRPDEALATYARRHDIDVIAIGARGSGLSEAVLGSVAERLLRTPGVLLLVAGRAVPRPSPAANEDC
jgi:nucleotide-binding universal stress UspA family protein